MAVWAQHDLLKLLDAMKVALPQKDLTKYKTSESHLDWQKVAFNSYTAEMCKQKWQEVSKEVRRPSCVVPQRVVHSLLCASEIKVFILSSVCTDSQIQDVNRAAF